MARRKPVFCGKPSANCYGRYGYFNATGNEACGIEDIYTFLLYKTKVFAGIDGCVAQHLFDAKQLVVFRDPFRAAG